MLDTAHTAPREIGQPSVGMGVSIGHGYDVVSELVYVWSCIFNSNDGDGDTNRQIKDLRYSIVDWIYDDTS